MTLNVSLRIMDGIVLASDSLATQMQMVNTQKMSVDTTCPACQNKYQQEVQTPPIRVPTSSWPYAQKVFPVQKRFGLATWGSAGVNNKSIYSHVSELDKILPKDEGKPEQYEIVSKCIVQYFTEQLLAEWKKTNTAVDLIPDAFMPFGFQFVGFTADASGESVPATHLIGIGKKSSMQPAVGIGCNVTGDTSVVQVLWQNNQNVANYPAFSLQDAVDYSKFLIRTTADFQRFLGRFPTVGGEIDIALVTNRAGFRWIEQKELYRMLEREERI